MKKKVFINGRFLTAPLTGVQRTAYELILALDNLLNTAENSTDFTLIYSGELKNPPVLKNIKLLKKGILKGNLWEQLELPLYTWGSLLLNCCSIAPLFKRKQFVIIHDASALVNKHFFSRAFNLWYGFAIPWLGRVCIKVITVSQFSKAELIKHAGINEQKIQVIYNAANHVLIPGTPDQEFINKINSYKPYCLAVSSLGANKNYSGLNAAFKLINFSPYNLVIAGGAVGVLSSSPVNGNAKYLGYVTDCELKYLYQNASLFIFPSFYEGFGIPPLEAMSLGCPVVASYTSSIPEVLDNACAYFDPYDIQDIAKKTASLIHDEQRLTQLKDLGYRQAEKYSWQKSAIALYTLINNYHG
jgi:glycosyltransferase involved in cell wall biosynthesis